MIYPHWLTPTARQWRQRKRKELKALIAAADRYSLGSAYTPGYGRFLDIRDHLAALSRDLSQKEWGK